ncbi:MAG: adenylate kinase [Marmoricola sp.]
MRLLIMGPPGSGKGTQAVHIARELAIPAISTGDIFRANVAEGTKLGRIAREYMDAGEYVPDHVTNAMVTGRLAEPDCLSGFLLDGFPRTLDQAEELERILGRTGDALDAVVELVVDREVLLERLLERARVQGRTDDTAEVIRRRQELYQEQTAPLTTYYAERGLLRHVDGDAAVSEVGLRFFAALSEVAQR